MKQKRTDSMSSIALGVFLLIFAAGCGRNSGGLTAAGLTNQNPSIVSVVSDRTVVVAGQETALITVTATDPEGETLTITGTASDGVLTKTGSNTFTFDPEEAGEFTISITARDPKGGVGAGQTIITSFGSNPTDGGISGSVRVPLSSHRIAGSASSDNILSEPVSIPEESGRDLSRAIRISDKSQGTSVCERKEFRAGEILLNLIPGTDMEFFASANRLNIIKKRAYGPSLVGMDISGISGSAALDATREKCVELNGKSEVEFADLNGISKHKATTPNDTMYASQWALPMMKLPQAWDITTGSSSVVVAVLDTGIVAGHSDFAGRLAWGYDFVSDPANACDGNGIDNNPEDVADSRCLGSPISMNSPMHSGYHGSHVAGTIGAATNNGTGVAGVDWAAKIIPIRVLGKEGGDDDDIIQGLYYAAGMANDSGTIPGTSAKVINMSLGPNPPGNCPAAYQAVFNQLFNAGITVLVAAGNEFEEGGNGNINPIARCNNVIGVAAVTRYAEHAWYSNTGTGVDISAPGGDTNDVESDGILSTVRKDSGTVSNTSYKTLQGTSMATPHIAGVVSLMLAANPSLTPTQIATLLGQTATDLGATGSDTVFGSGLVNSYAAVKAAKDLVSPVVPPANPVLTLSTSKLYFATDETSKTAIITNTGSGTLTLTSVTDTETSGGNWMTVSQSTSEGKIVLTATVSRANLPSGQYTGTISIVSNGGNASVAVTMQVDAPVPQIPTGCQDFTIYILAVDPDSYDTVAQAEFTAGSAGYKMFEAPAGDYFVVAGTDCNQDDEICDQDMDYCGVYPMDEDPSIVTVGAKAFTPGIDFSLSRNAARASGSTGNYNSLPRKSFKLLK